MRVKVQHMDLIMRKHNIEEGRERRDQAGPKGVDKEGDLSRRPVNASARRRPSHRLSPLIEAGGEHGTHLAHGLIVEHQRSAAGGALAEDRGFFPLSACVGAIALGQAELRLDWKKEQSPGEAEELEENGASDGRITM